MKNKEKNKEKNKKIAILFGMASMFIIIFALVFSSTNNNKISKNILNNKLKTQINKDLNKSNKIGLAPTCAILLKPGFVKSGEFASLSWIITGGQNVNTARLECNLLGEIEKINDKTILDLIKENSKWTVQLPGFDQAGGQEICKLYLNDATYPCESNSIIVEGLSSTPTPKPTPITVGPSCIMSFKPQNINVNLGYSVLDWKLRNFKDGDKAKLKCDILYKQGVLIYDNEVNSENPSYEYFSSALFMGPYGTSGTEKCGVYLNEETEPLCLAELIINPQNPTTGCDLKFNPDTIVQNNRANLNWSIYNNSNIKRVFINCDSGMQKDLTQFARKAKTGSFPTIIYSQSGQDSCELKVDYNEGHETDNCTTTASLMIKGNLPVTPTPFPTFRPTPIPTSSPTD